MTEFQIADCQKVLEKFVDDTRTWGEGSPMPNPFEGWYRYCIKEAALEVHQILSSA